MKLSVMTPLAIIHSASVRRIHLPTVQGDWCLLPRHADTALLLKPGIMTYNGNAESQAMALSSGLCVKTGAEVVIATSKAIASDRLEDLSEAVEKQYSLEEDEERRAQTALAQIEIGLIRRLLDLEHIHAP